MKNKYTLSEKLLDINYSEMNDIDVINKFGEVILEHCGSQEIANIGIKWINNIMSLNTKDYASQMAELVSKMAVISETHKNLQKIVSGVTSIALDQMMETDEMPFIMDEIQYRNSEKALKILRGQLQKDYGVLIHDSLVSPKVSPDDTLNKNSSYLGDLVFGAPNKKGDSFVIRTFSPSVSSPLTLTERIDFSIPTGLLLLGFHSSEDVEDVNIRYISISKENTARKESGLYNIKNIKDIKFGSISKRKINKLEEIIKLRESQGYNLLALTIVERPEGFTNKATNTEHTLYATNIDAIFLKRGTSIIPGDDIYDEIKVQGWVFNEFDKESGYNVGDMQVNTVVADNGWRLKRYDMDLSIDKLKKFANLNIKSLIDKNKKVS